MSILTDVISSTISTASLAVAFSSLIIVRSHGKRTEVSGFMIQMYKDFCQAEEKFHFAPDNDAKLFYVNQYLNLLEVYCGISNQKTAPRDSVELLEDRLANDLRNVDRNPVLRDHIEKILSSPLTFSETRKFYERNRTTIKSNPHG